MNKTVLLSTLLLSGCVTYKITYTNGVVEQASPQKVEKRHNTFVGGFVEPSPVNVSQHCPYGFQQIDHEIRFTDRLLSYAANTVLALVGVGAVPMFWYEPHTVTVHCNEKPLPDPSIQKQVEQAEQQVEQEINKSEEELKKEMDKVQKEMENAVEELDSAIE